MIKITGLDNLEKHFNQEITKLVDKQITSIAQNQIKKIKGLKCPIHGASVNEHSLKKLGGKEHRQEISFSGFCCDHFKDQIESVIKKG